MSRILSRQPSSRFAVPKPRHHRRPSRAALRTLEVLEPRTLLSTLYVNSSNTNSSPNGSQANPYKTIQAAINAAVPSTTILVETGKGYSESDTVSTGLSNLTIKADTSQVPILDGGGQSSPGFTIQATGVTIAGLTIQNFHLSSEGAGVVVDSGASLTLSGDTIQNNAAENGSQGGGIYNSGTLTVTGGSLIAANNAGFGGGIYDAGGVVNITGGTLSGNNASFLGGGIYNSVGTVTVTTSTLSGNGAGDGGGIANNAGTVMVIMSTLSNNTASGSGGGGGGGIANNAGTVMVIMSTLSNNTASGSGGGIDNSIGTLNVVDSTVAGNSAQAGGGIDNLGTLTSTNSTIAYNEAVAAGGGGGLGTATGATSILHNTIVALNTDGSGSGAHPDDIAGTVDTADSAYNLIGDSGSSGGLTNGTNGNQVGVAPGLAGGLANNGGPTATIALLAGSPAINAGSNNLAVDPSGNPLLYDQRGPGFLRFEGGIVSIGAYQANVLLPTPTTVYVNTAWAGNPLYTGVTWIDGSVHVIGYDAFATIQGGINAVPSSGFVYVAPETDHEQVTISKSVTVTGQGSSVLAGSGTGVGFTVAATGVTISGLTIKDFATGVVVNSSASVTLSGDTIEDNTNSGGGGGGVSSTGAVNITGSTISNNSATSGGGFYNSSTGAVNITASTISNNSATSGGGFYNSSTGAVNITASTISNNSATSGGGFYNHGGPVTFTASILSNNTATSGGGGVDNEVGQVTITGVTIANNSAGGNGGGILNDATLAVVNTTIANNSAGHGGGIYNNGTLTSVNSTIAYNFISSGSNKGGGLDVAGGTAKLDNTIVALNTDGTGSSATADDIAGTVSTASSYNLIGTGGSGGLTSTNSTGNLLNTASANVGLASALAANGGLTPTLALLPGSFAIDAGSASISGVTVPSTDQRGFPRLGGIDIGAFQVDPTPKNVYVNSAWAGYLPGTQVYFPGDSVDVHYVGYDGFAAIQVGVNAVASGGFAYVASGTYNENVTIKESMTVTGPGSPVLQGSGLGVGFTVAATGVTIAGFTIENFATGVVVDSGASLTLIVDTIEGNTNAKGDGGGVRNAGTLTIHEGVISGNSASNGGGIFNSGGQVQISGAVLSGNSAADAGGGILVQGGSLTINNGIVSDNFAFRGIGDGAGIADLSGGVVKITGGSLSNNFASDDGGGIYVESGTLTITGATVSDNSANSGGGIFNSRGQVSVTACNIANNTGFSHGGGIYNNAGPLKVTNSTIANNSGSNGGGGIYTASSVLTTVNTTIAYNTAGGSGEGGGLDVSGGTATLYNTIVALNTDSSGSGATPDDIAGTVSTASSYNLIGVGGSGGLTITNSTGNLLNVSRANASLASGLGNNGGPTETIALLPASYAINAGSASIPGVTVPTVDQRGASRAGGIDIGAFQLVATSGNGSYVDSAWAGDPAGTQVTWTDGSTHTIGFDAFATIQGGVNAVGVDGFVHVAAGTYTAGPIIINQSLSLVGAGAATTVIQAPSNLNTGDEISIAGGASVSITGVTVDGASNLTAIDVNGATLSASAITVTGYNTAISVRNQGAATITTCTITGNAYGILVGSSSSDTSTLTANYDSFSGDTVGVDSFQSSGSLNATFDWWGNISGPTNAGNPGGTGSPVMGNVNFSPWLGSSNILAPTLFVFNATTGNQYVLTPSGGNTGLAVTLGGNPVGTIPGGRTLDFTGSGGTVTINGESGSPDVFTIQDTSVQFNASDGLSGTTINFINGGTPTRNVDALGTSNTFNIQGAGASGPSGSLVGDSGTNAFVFSATGKVLGNIQGGGSSTLNYSAYSSGVTVNLGTKTATGVTGTVSGITAVIGSNSNDTLNAGSVANVALTGGLGTNTLSGTGAGDSVVESISSSYTLTNTKLTGTSASFTDNLSGITVANLTGSSATSNAFNVSGWTGSGSLSVPSGTATVTASENAGFTLTNTLLTSGTMSLILSGITTANLTDTGSGHTFTITGWTGSGTLKGTSSETLVDSVSSSVVLANTSLAVTGLPTLTLSGFTTATLSDTAGGHTFTVGGWTGSGSLTDSSTTGDTVAASKNAGFTLTNTLLTSGTMSLILSGITIANLTDTGGSHTFTVGGWTGSGSLTDSAAVGDTVAASKSAGYTLTNTSLSATDGMSLGLSGITTANLTATATSGSPSYIVDASAFTGVTNLTAGGTVNAILFGGSANLSTLIATGSGNDVLIGGAGKDTLTDTGTGFNILIGGPGADTLTGNGNDILISGTTSYDSNTSANIAALDAILAEWSSSDSYSLRITKIMNGVGTGGSDALNSSTCQSDGVANTVKDGTAATQNNWFIVNNKDTVTKKSNETETIV